MFTVRFVGKRIFFSCLRRDPTIRQTGAKGERAGEAPMRPSLPAGPMSCRRSQSTSLFLASVYSMASVRSRGCGGDEAWAMCPFQSRVSWPSGPAALPDAARPRAAGCRVLPGADGHSDHSRDSFPATRASGPFVLPFLRRQLPFFRGHSGSAWVTLLASVRVVGRAHRHGVDATGFPQTPDHDEPA